MQMTALLAALLLSILPPQDPTRRVHDLANVLTPEQAASIENVTRDVEQKTSAQIAVVTVPSLDGRTVDDYGHDLFNTWGIGQKDLNNGVLLLVAPNERRLRIEVGYGLEPLLTDSICGEIRDKQLIPHFKNGDYAQGIEAGTQAIAEVILSKLHDERSDRKSSYPVCRQTKPHSRGRKYCRSTHVFHRYRCCRGVTH